MKGRSRQTSFRQSMTWLHTWFGLVFCWIMYYMFVTGTLGYFDTEIDQWMQPELPVYRNVSLGESVQAAESYLRENAHGAKSWNITPVKDRHPYLSVSWQWPSSQQGEESRPRGFKKLDVRTGEPLDLEVRDTGGGQLLYKMHYKLHYIDRDLAYKFIGLVTLLMFVGVVTGIVVHRKIFVDMFTFRPDKGVRAWLDLHNLASVTSLPFQLMISYSGLLFVVTTFFPLIAIGGFGFDATKARDQIPKLLGINEVVRSEQIAPLTSVYQLVMDLDLPVERIRSINVLQPGDANSVIHVFLQDGVATRAADQLSFSGVTGERIKPDTEEAKNDNSALVFASTFLGLHEGLFASPFLRWLYFIAGVAGSIMLATGSIYWVQKRQQRAKKSTSLGRGFTLVNNLNIGTVVGLMTAVAAYFLANRLLPLAMEERHEWEVNIMYLTWGLCLLHPFLRSNKRRAWFEQCLLAAVAYCSIPVVNFLTTDVHLGYSLASGNWVLAGFDLIALLTGMCFLVAARLLRRRNVIVRSVNPSPLAADS